MKLLHQFSFTVFLFLTVTAVGQWQPIGAVTAVKPLPNGVEVQAARARVRLTALSASVIRARYSADGVFPPEHSFAVLPTTGFSAPAVRVSDSASAAEFSTGPVRVRIEKSPLRLIFLNEAGEVILQDAKPSSVAWNGKEFRVWKFMPENEHYFGLGDKAGPLDHRNQAFTMWNTDAYGWQESTDPLYKTLGCLRALRKGASYGIFFDNTYRQHWDLGKASPDEYSFGPSRGCVDSY